ncbi:MAG TPA: histidinol-phosphate transaminase [Burkholderiaceae bacterium]|nr:histidinol-phosphate transaminase [Burkholderiaceae bacterium]
MQKYWSPFVRGLTPYVPGEQPPIADLIKLNTNENPYPPSPAALAALRQAADANLRLYPNPSGERLKEEVAAIYGVPAASVFVGNGSDEILAHTFCALLKHALPVLFPDVTYSFYPVYCGLYGIEYRTLPLTADFRIRIADYAAPNGGIVFPNPNAPTGCLLPLADVEALLATNPDSVVVIDEAYIDFGGASAIPLIARYPNLLVTQTLSKSRALAGLRVGFAIGDPGLIQALERVKSCFNSYPVDRLALAGAVAALADREHFERTRAAMMASRETLARDLRALAFDVLPSAANFLFVRHAHADAATLLAELRARKILVRRFEQPARIAQFLRISIGTDAQCQELVAALREILAN